MLVIGHVQLVPAHPSLIARPVVIISLQKLINIIQILIRYAKVLYAVIINIVMMLMEEIVTIVMEHVQLVLIQGLAHVSRVLMVIMSPVYSHVLFVMFLALNAHHHLMDIVHNVRLIIIWLIILMLLQIISIV